ncbi:MAG: amino acid permease, partial [Planctomycetia bacterium]|nr:amino acid permease [Planctomycetia bacterium]
MVLEDMQNHEGLRRTLGPISLTSLGVGAIIGTGIFIVTGLAARQYAGPALIISFILAGLACTFAALCYAEFASMAPVAGSAYTYAYLSLGEFFAWIIGWDLLLEYSIASSSVACGWSHYFIKFLALFRDSAGKALITIPAFLTCDPITATQQHADYLTATHIRIESVTAIPYHPEQGTERLTLPVGDREIHRLKKIEITFTPESTAAVRQLHGASKADRSIARVKNRLGEHLIYDPQADLDQSMAGIVDGAKNGYDACETTPWVVGGVHLTCNILVAAVIMTLCVILVLGIRESTLFNAIMVFIKLGAVLFVVFAGIGHVDTSNWSPFMPYGWSGVMGGAAIVFFAYIGFDSVSTHAEEAKNPNRDVPIGIIGSLVICTALYIAVSIVITGMVPYVHIPLDAPIAAIFTERGLAIAATVITVGAIAGITSVLLVLLLSLPRVLMAIARDGLLPRKTFATVHPKFKTPWIGTILTCTF